MQRKLCEKPQWTSDGDVALKHTVLMPMALLCDGPCEFVIAWVLSRPLSEHPSAAGFAHSEVKAPSYEHSHGC